MCVIAALCLAHPQGLAHETRGEEELLSESLDRVETLQREVMRLRKKNERLRRSLSRMKKRMHKLSGEMRELSNEMRQMRAASAERRKSNADRENAKDKRRVAPSSTSPVTLAPRSVQPELVSATVSVSKPKPEKSPSWFSNPLSALGNLFVGEENAAAPATVVTARNDAIDVVSDESPSEPPRGSDNLVDARRDTRADTEANAEDDTEMDADFDAKFGAKKNDDVNVDAGTAADDGAEVAAIGAETESRFEEGIVYGALGNDRASAQYERAMEWLDRNRPDQFKIAMREWLEQYGATDNALQADALYWLAEAYYADEDWAQARQYYARLVKDFPRSARRDGARLKIAYLLHKDKNYAAAEDILRALLQSNDAKVRRLAQIRLERVKKDKP